MLIQAIFLEKKEKSKRLGEDIWCFGVFVKLPLSWPMSFFSILFCLPHAAEQGSDKAALVGTWLPVKVNPPHFSEGESFFF